MTFHQNLPAQKPQAESEPRSVYRLAYDEFAAWATGGAAPNSTPNGNRRYSPPARARIPHRSTSAAWARPLGTRHQRRRSTHARASPACPPAPPCASRGHAARYSRKKGFHPFVTLHQSHGDSGVLSFTGCKPIARPVDLQVHQRQFYNVRDVWRRLQ